MNLALRSASFPPTSQAADGLPRRRFSIAEIEAMVQAEIISEDERFELIGGEIVPMSPKGARHEWIKMELARFLMRAAPEHLGVIPETTLRLDESTFLEPDFTVFPRRLALEKLDGPAVLLAIEVADSSLAYDRGRKIGIYAAYGVREVWVVDAKKATIWVHKRLGAEGYAVIAENTADVLLTPAFAPELALRLADLGVAPLA